LAQVAPQHKRVLKMTAASNRPRPPVELPQFE
jgi:hypothetical protein